MEKSNRFADVDVCCRQCGFRIGFTVADSQALILESSGIGVWNFVRWQCLSCGKNGSWVSPHLRGLELSGDIDSLEDLPKPPKNIRVTQSGFRGVSKSKNKFKARYKEKYLGLYDSPELASLAVDRAKNKAQQRQAAKNDYQPT